MLIVVSPLLFPIFNLYQRIVTYNAKAIHVTILSIVLLIDCIIFYVPSRTFHSYRDVTIASEWLSKPDLGSATTACEQGGIFIVPRLLSSRLSGQAKSWHVQLSLTLMKKRVQRCVTICLNMCLATCLKRIGTPCL